MALRSAVLDVVLGDVVLKVVLRNVVLKVVLRNAYTMHGLSPPLSYMRAPPCDSRPRIFFESVHVVDVVHLGHCRMSFCANFNVSIIWTRFPGRHLRHGAVLWSR